MKTFAFLFMLILSSAFLHAQEITFTKNPPPTGLVIEQLDTLEMDLAYSFEGSDEVLMKTKNRLRNHSTMTVLETDSDSILRYRLQVHEAWESGKKPESGKINKSTDGKTYIIERRGDSTAVLREDGSDAGAVERAEILRETGQKVWATMTKFLDGRTLRIGESPMVEKDLMESFKHFIGNTPLTLIAASMKLIDIRTVQNLRCGVFEMNLKLGGSQAAAEMETDINGEVTVSAESLWPLSIVMTGDVRGVTLMQDTSMSISGDMTAATISTLAQP